MTTPTIQRPGVRGSDHLAKLLEELEDEVAALREKVEKARSEESRLADDEYLLAYA